MEQVQRARDRGLPIFAEICPHYLVLDDSLYNRSGFEGAKYVLTLPLPPVEPQHVLWQGIRAGDIAVISTNHRPYCFVDQKAIGQDDFSRIPNGGPGLENRLSLIYNSEVHGGDITDNQFVNLVSTKPAKLFGLFLRKGTIAVDSDGDLVVFDPDGEAVISAVTHVMNVDYNMCEGIHVRGTADEVLLRGKSIVRGRKYVGDPGNGEFVPRRRYNYMT